MRVYKPKHKENGKTKQCEKWWLEFRDPNGIVQRWGLGTTSQDVADITASQISSLNEWAKKELNPPDDLVKWTRRQTPKFRDKIYKAGLLKAGQASDTKTITEHLDSYIRDLEVNSDSGYAEQIRTQVEKITKNLGFEFWADVVDKGPDIRAFLDNTFAKNTANHYLISFKMFGNWLLKHRQIKEKPVMGKIDFDVPEQRAFEENELNALYETTRTGPDAYGMSGHKRFVLYRLGFDSGLRRDELRSLRRTSFDFERCIVFVGGQDTKNSKGAYQRLTPETAALVKDLVKNMTPDAKIFDIPNNSAEMIRKDAEAAGIELENWQGKIKFHSLRHSLATHLASKSVPMATVQKIMRHASIETTAKYYTHQLRGAEDNAINLLKGFGEKRTKEKTA